MVDALDISELLALIELGGWFVVFGLLVVASVWLMVTDG